MSGGRGSHQLITRLGWRGCLRDCGRKRPGGSPRQSIGRVRLAYLQMKRSERDWLLALRVSSPPPETRASPNIAFTFQLTFRGCRGNPKRRRHVRCLNRRHDRREQVEIRTPDGTVDALLTRPTSPVPLPAVINLTDGLGFRQAFADQSKRIAEHGYVVLTPNIFYRISKPPVFPFAPDFADERTRTRFAEPRLLSRLTRWRATARRTSTSSRHYHM